MRIGDILYFSPNYKFATGVLYITTVDFLARITKKSGKVGQRIKKWLTENIPDFNETLAQRFYDEFRNGLIHEGRRVSKIKTELRRE